LLKCRCERAPLAQISYTGRLVLQFVSENSGFSDLIAQAFEE